MPYIGREVLFDEGVWNVDHPMIDAKPFGNALRSLQLGILVPRKPRRGGDDRVETVFARFGGVRRIHATAEQNADGPVPAAQPAEIPVQDLVHRGDHGVQSAMLQRRPEPQHSVPAGLRGMPRPQTHPVRGQHLPDALQQGVLTQQPPVMERLELSPTGSSTRRPSRGIRDLRSDATPIHPAFGHRIASAILCCRRPDKPGSASYPPPPPRNDR